MTDISQEAVERFSPALMEDGEGAYMRKNGINGAWVTLADYHALERRAERAPAQVLAGVRERLTMEAAEGLVQAYATGGAEAFATEVRALLGEGE